MKRLLPILAALALTTPVAAWAGTNATLYFRATQTNGVSGYDLSSTPGSVAPNGTQVSATSCGTGGTACPTTWRTYYSINTLNADKTITTGSTWTVVLWGYESSNSANNGYRAIVSYRRGTTDTVICTTGASTELVRTNPGSYTLTCTNSGSLSLQSGDRIKVEWQLTNVGTAASGYTDYQHFDGNTGGSAGDSKFTAPVCLPNVTDTCSQTFNESFSEAITAGESLAQNWTHAESFSEAITAGDSATGEKAGGITLDAGFPVSSGTAGVNVSTESVTISTAGTNRLIVISARLGATATYTIDDHGLGLSWTQYKASGHATAVLFYATAAAQLTSQQITVNITNPYALRLTAVAFAGTNGVAESNRNTIVNQATTTGNNDAISITATAAGSVLVAAYSDWNSSTARSPMTGSSTYDTFADGKGDYLSMLYSTSVTTGAGSYSLGHAVSSTTDTTAAIIEVLAAGAQTINEPFTEAITMASTQVDLGPWRDSYSEAITAAESFSAHGVTYKAETASEAITTGESHTNAQTMPHSFTEEISLDATYSSAATYPHTMGEALDMAVTALDEWIQGGGGPKTYNESFNEILSAGDSLASAALYAHAFSEAFTASETIQNAQTFVDAFNEILSMADSQEAATTFGTAFIEAISTADQIIQNVLLTYGISEDFSPGETLEQNVQFLEAAQETISLTDEVTHQAVCVQIFSEAVTLGVDVSTVGTPNVYNETITEALNMVCAPSGGGTLERGGTNE